MVVNRGIKILGTGSYKPDFEVDNAEFSKFVETDDEWIVSRTGIRSRRFNKAGSNATMTAIAAERALISSGVSALEIDMIIASTTTPDYFFPSLSCLVQHEIGAANAFAIDVSAACTGFINAIDVARNYLANGECGKILVIAGEMLSRQTDFTDRATCVLFGDGAGAIVIESANKDYTAYMGAIGENYRDISLFCKANYNTNIPFANFESEESTPKGTGFLQMNGKEVYKFASDIMPKAIEKVCEKAGISLSEIDILIPHQANIRIISAAMKNLGLPSEKVYINIEKTGNISSACIPVCLDELYLSGKIKSGMKICAVAFGGGLTYGAILFEA